MPRHFRFSCVGAHGKNLEDLFHLIDNNREITRKTFVQNVSQEDRKELEANLGYSRVFPISQDWHVSYHKAKTATGKKAYYLRHSAIEYVFY